MYIYIKYYIYMCIYMYIEREREKERQGERERTEERREELDHLNVFTSTLPEKPLIYIICTYMTIIRIYVHNMYLYVCM